MRKQEIINKAFNDLPDLFDGWFNVRERLHDMNLEQERRHRKNEATPKSFPATIAAKYFVCRHLLDGLAEPNKFTVDDILSIRTEVLYAQAYAKKHSDALECWAEKWINEINSIDYADLMKVA